MDSGSGAPPDRVRSTDVTSSATTMPPRSTPMASVQRSTYNLPGVNTTTPMSEMQSAEPLAPLQPISHNVDEDPATDTASDDSVFGSLACLLEQSRVLSRAEVDLGPLALQEIKQGREVTRILRAELQAARADVEGERRKLEERKRMFDKDAELEGLKLGVMKLGEQQANMLELLSTDGANVDAILQKLSNNTDLAKADTEKTHKLLAQNAADFEAKLQKLSNNMDLAKADTEKTHKLLAQNAADVDAKLQKLSSDMDLAKADTEKTHKLLAQNAADADAKLQKLSNDMDLAKTDVQGMMESLKAELIQVLRPLVASSSSAEDSTGQLGYILDPFGPTSCQHVEHYTFPRVQPPVFQADERRINQRGWKFRDVLRGVAAKDSMCWFGTVMDAAASQDEERNSYKMEDGEDGGAKFVGSEQTEVN
ncbi:hypothetical protein B0A49_01262 [Cryomyces minteri]|uniref:Uncharacterized protein n=1 Tax=Cryomyces minteri TaxID=331657 RepID=A0A4U0XZZ9_9PEZI|nr:hypothetical protein B0A49_01262 [Cryomyces minteri]